MHKRVFCLGDSNIDTWRLVQRINPIDGYSFTTTSIFGNTCVGINKLDSSSNSLLKYREAIEKNKHSDYCILGMGENDTGKMIWLLSERRKVTPKEVIQTCIDELIKFIKNELSGVFDNHKIIVQSCPMPTVTDPTKTNLRKEVDVPLDDRIAHTHYFNDCLKETCKSLNLHFLDTTTPTIDTKTNQIQPKYINKWWDHHLKKDTAIALFRESFLQFIDKNG